MPTLIYIHGRGLKVSAQDEQQKWFASLQTGLKRISPEVVPTIAPAQLQMAYWSDIFYPITPTAENPQGLADHEKAVVDLLMGELRAAQALNPLASAAGVTTPPNDRNRVLGSAQMPTADAGGKQAADSFVRDVIKYFGLGYAAKVRVPFVRLLTDLPLDDGLAVVTHSFGTLVAYDVLISSMDQINAARKIAGRREILVDTWVTMGSPLGWAHDLQSMLPTFAQQILVQPGRLGEDVGLALTNVKNFAGGLFHKSSPPSAPVATAAPADGTQAILYEVPAKQFPPTCVDRWFNIFDPRDPVSGEFGIGALTVADTFLDGKPGALTERAFDITIKNDFAPPNSWAVTMDAHNDRGYGQTAQLAQVIHDFWFRWDPPSSPSS